MIPITKMLAAQELNALADRDRKSGLPAAKEIFLIAVLGMLFTALWAIQHGKGISWDQQNYHHYNVYSWLNGRLDYDVAPAGQQSWFNPLPYLPQYWLVDHVSPVVAGGIFGAWVGLNFALVYALARLTLQCGSWLAIGLALACLAVGFSDPPFLGLIGTTDIDQLVSLPVLGSLCLVSWALGPGKTERQQNQAYAWAGVLLGAAAGLKWTCFVYALGMALTLVVLWRLLRMSLKRFGWFAVGGLLGYLPTGGYWNWVLWSRFDNPFFPYWNRYFRSDWAVAGNFRDMRFPPQSVEAAIMFPFQWFVGLHPSSESPFRDARFAFLSVLIPIAVAVFVGKLAARRWAHREENGDANKQFVSRERQWLLLTFALLSYVAWIKVFAIHRYLTPLTLLSGLLLLLVLDWLIPSKLPKLAAFSLLAIFCVLWTRVEPDNWRVPYASSWFGVGLPQQVQEPDTMFIMLGDGAMGYVVPYLSGSARAVRLSGPMLPLDAETQMVRRAEHVIADHRGPMRSLSIAPLSEADLAYLSRFGLALNEQECAQFRTATDQFTSCPVIRQSATDSPGRSPEGAIEAETPESR